MNRIVIIEDEALAADRLVELLKEQDFDFEILKTLESVEDSLEWFQQNDSPDLVFMDIELADGTSFDFLQRFELKCPVIFVTAYDQFALKAFEVLALDYILKPVKADNLQRALERYQRTALDQDNDANRMADAGRSRFVIRLGQRLHIVEYTDIAYLYSQEKSTFLVTKENKKFTLDQSLDQLEKELESLDFFRLNRKFLVSDSSIDTIKTLPKSKLLISLMPVIDLPAIVSSEKSASFKKWIAKT